jgi:hypothetical protein
MFEELEKIELAEEVFGIDFPVDLTENLTVNNPREVVDYFALHLKGWGPNPAAADFLKNLDWTVKTKPFSISTFYRISSA